MLSLASALSKSPPTIAVAAVAFALGAAAAAFCQSGPLRRLRRRRCILEKAQLAWATKIARTFWIQHVRIPIAVLPHTPGFLNHADEEGLVDCHVRIQDGKISDILVKVQTKKDATSPSPPPSSWTTPIVQGHGCLFLPCFVDAHTHLVKTQTAPRLRNRTGTMGEAVAVEARDHDIHWSNAENVQRLMDFGLRCAVHHGSKALRTHLDGCASDDAKVVEAVYRAYDYLVEKYNSQHNVTVQGVANLYLPLWLQEPFATQHADRAAQHVNTVLGAYVGNPAASSEREQTVQAMTALLGHAQRLGLDVDLHIDESNDPSCCALLSLVEALKDARKSGYEGRIVLGHCCALSLQDSAAQKTICRALAELGAYVIANPTTNLSLQDRRGSTPPYGTSIPADIPRTPQWRGLTLVQELEAAGVVTAVASDNVRDHWYSFGDFDLLNVWSFGLQLLHLDTVPSAGAWAHLCTDAPAKAMGLTSNFEIGQDADGVLFPRARRFTELLARPQMDRLVIRNGKLQATSLPDFAELDDLVAEPTPRPRPEAFARATM